ncbi:hypothetical protein BLNAU_19481 [Blattamonas nauphoetae]|uniref:SPRY domain-containing protein n=1 Tax=Blattamonas nauphoetae TaxID=2049346 RepID=A0ABQ9X1D2_9EUKA|nr:hypothetical protein BLNAU_19481 [Blattamonas nauphoetae]
MDSEDDGWRQQSYMTASSAAHGARLGKKPASQQRLEISPQKSTPIRDSPIIIRPPLEPLQPELDDAPLLTEDSPVRSFHSSPQKSGLESSVSIQNPLLSTITSDTFTGPLPTSNWVILGHLLIARRGYICEHNDTHRSQACSDECGAVQLNAVKKPRLPASAFAMKKGKNFLNDAQTAKAPSKVIIASRKYRQADGSAPTEGDCCDLVEWLSNAIVEQKKCVFLHSLEKHGRVGLLAGLVLARLFHAAPTRILSSLQHAHKCRVGSPKVACPSTHEQKMLLYRLASVFDQPITETQRLQSSERIAARIPETGLSVGKKLTAQQTRPQSVAVYTKSSSRGNRLYLNNCNVLLKTPVTQGIFSVTVIVLSLSNIVYHAGVVRMGLFDSTAVVHKLSDALGSEVEDSLSLETDSCWLALNTPSTRHQSRHEYYFSELREGDCVRMEVDMDSKPRTVHFFVNGQNGRSFVSSLSPSVRICFTVEGQETSFRIDRIAEQQSPTPITPEMTEIKWE